MANKSGFWRRPLPPLAKGRLVRRITIKFQFPISNSLVVDVNQYEKLKPNGSEFEQYADAQSTLEEDPVYCILFAHTSWRLREKVVRVWHSEWLHMKQHKQTYRIMQLREPVGFRMSTPTHALVRKTWRSDPKAPLEYSLSTGVLQAIAQNIGALDVS